jgi:hypothetical protein
MVAAMLCQDSTLLNWLKLVAQVRYDYELCEEYRPVFQEEDLFVWRDPDFLRHEIYNNALAMVADIKSRLVSDKSSKL